MGGNYNNALLNICGIIKGGEFTAEEGLKILEEAKGLLLSQSTAFREKAAA